MTSLKPQNSSDVFSLKLICYFFPYMGFSFFRAVLDKRKQISLLTLFNIQNVALLFPGICAVSSPCFFPVQSFLAFEPFSH